MAAAWLTSRPKRSSLQVGGLPSDYPRAAFADDEIRFGGFVGCIQVTKRCTCCPSLSNAAPHFQEVKPSQIDTLDLGDPVRSQRRQVGDRNLDK